MNCASNPPTRQGFLIYLSPLARLVMSIFLGLAKGGVSVVG